MAIIITQYSLDYYMYETQISEELKKLQDILNNIPDERLIYLLEEQRVGNRSVGSGRNDYPIRPMWNAYLAARILHGGDISAMIRELNRNPSLMRALGFKEYKVPTHNAFTNLKKSLMKYQDEVNAIFDTLVDDMYVEIPEFGKSTAVDGKILTAAAKGKNKSEDKVDDGRSDFDAEYTIKQQPYTAADGSGKVKKKTYFGYRAHILADTKTDLPIAFEVTPANTSEGKIAKKLFKGLSEYRLDSMEYFLADKGYDDTKLIELVKSKDVKPLIDIRNQWRGEETKQYKDTDIVYTYDGQVYIIDDKLEQVKLKYAGYDCERKALRYEHIQADGKSKVYRINIDYDQRVFLPVARDSMKYKRLYNARTSVERLNGRIDRDFGFETNTIRGLKKMKLELTTTFIIMLANAKRHIQNDETNYASIRA